jgi:hypothetical protein
MKKEKIIVIATILILILNIMNLLDFKIQDQRGFKFGLCTREVVKISENKFEIHDTSCGWTSAIVDKKTMQGLIDGNQSLLDINFN